MRGQLIGQHRRFITRARQTQAVTAERIAIQADVLGAGAVTRLAGDAKLRRLRVANLHATRRRSGGSLQPWLAERSCDTRYTCCSSCRFLKTAWWAGASTPPIAESSGALRRGTPLATGRAVSPDRSRTSQICWRCEPVVITTCRATRGRESPGSESRSSSVAHNSEPRRLSDIGRPGTSFTSTPSNLATTVSGVATCVIVRWYELTPRRILTGMTGLARVRGCVTVVSNLDGSVGDLSFGDGASERGPQGPGEKARGDHAHDEGDRWLAAFVVRLGTGRSVRL